MQDISGTLFQTENNIYNKSDLFKVLERGPPQLKQAGLWRLYKNVVFIVRAMKSHCHVLRRECYPTFM